MRYYSIQITTDPDGSTTNDGKNKFPRTFTSFINGRSDPAALLVELDIPVAPFGTPGGKSGAFIRVWGISLADISQAFDFNGKYIKVFGGMQKGLPLANPKQAGLLVSGQITQAFGNWQNTDMTLDMLIVTAGDSDSQKNLAFPWPAGTKMADMIRSTLKTAFPTYTADINISPKLVLNDNEPGFYSNIQQFAQYLTLTSQGIIDPRGTTGYTGVNVVVRERVFSVYDGTTRATPTGILFQELIGQPTWIDPGTIQFKCAMRADIPVGGYIKLPPTPVVTSAASLSQFSDRNKSVFQGTWQNRQLRHVGNSRQPDASSWVTVFDCFPVADDVTAASGGGVGSP